MRFCTVPRLTFLRLAGWLSLWLLVALPTVRVRAQAAAAATLMGTTKSEKGDPLVGATVVALHLPTGTRLSATTDAQGQFWLPALLPGGPYVLQVVQPGFRPQVINNVFIEEAHPLDIGFALALDVVGVGTRRQDRTVASATGPVDVLEMRSLLLTNPSADLTQVLHYNVPSFNSTRQATADGADHVDPNSLRGLAPDQMLVLVNGKRQHTTALINLLGNRGIGSVGYDLNAFSVNALDRVEVLRDGAAAQYGSDAIAGVMNLALRADNHGGNVLVSTGLHSYGDGLMTTLSLNKGLKLGRQGFLNLTGEADYHGATTRHYARELNSWPVYSGTKSVEDSFLLANRKTYADYRQRNGNAQMLNFRGVLNAGYRLSENARLYAFGTINQRYGNSAALWRLPANADRLSEQFPLGYQPEINTRLLDGSGVVGTAFSLGGWSLDLSQTLGTNRMAYDVTNTLNTSLGANSPTEFRAGALQFTQAVTNATATRLFPGLLAGTNVAFGGEFRAESYRITAGDPASYTLYQQGGAGAEPGSQGFFGYSNLAAGQSRRTIGAGFVDVEADIVKHWTVEAALRYENYSTFGGQAIFKGATRVQVRPGVVLRAGYNSGFRAPSLQQENYQQITILPTQGDVRFAGIFSNSSALARTANIPKLGSETSNNYSAGLVLTPAPGFTLSADGYLIEVKNRILLTGAIERDSVHAPQFTAALTAIDADRAQFFVNAARTRTLGLDLVASYVRPVGAGELRLRLAGNLARHEVNLNTPPAEFGGVSTDANLGNDYIDQRQLSLLQTGTPRAKVHAQLGYARNKFSALLRETYFGQVAYYDYNYEGLAEGAFYLVFRPRTTTDLALTYQPAKAFSLAAGANNVFNVLPDTKLQAARNGNARNAAMQAIHGYDSYLPYDRDIIPYEPVQMGFNGAFFYLKAAYGIGQ